MKKSNIQYIIFTVIFTFAMTLFFTSGLWIGDSKKNMSEAYNKTITVCDAWELKINNAAYNPALKTLTLDYYQKEKNANKTELPKIEKVTLGNSTGEILTFNISDMNTNEYGKRITVYSVPDEFYYIRVYISVKRLDTQKESTIDEFGNTITYPVEIGKTDTIYIGVDYRDAVIAYQSYIEEK